jgi:hypothetical protein
MKTRIIGIFGLGGGFLVLSPTLRHDVVEALGRQSQLLNQYSPLSYIAIGAAALAAAMVYMYRCSKLR